ncbi:GAF domain-containing protein [Chitiniphilus eburneus]|uniref:GAF domain-containing protein n=1 Tax=Chitiniphilus eburneus TaxID=2571148 RepID=A0A4U0P819_9NEIS|nr:GAF domain-containing protein [Chitiniphilus eburneus]TJZ63655.1 GAF domain-containing protein [Chitiniphilus eburneus]
MLAPAKPANEPKRLEALARLRILHSEPDAVFDELVSYVIHALGVAGAGICLVAEDTVWFKAAEMPLMQAGSRDESFCAHLVAARETMLEVNDATLDPRFADHPAVLHAGLRFYAGMAVILRGGLRIGSVFVVDTQPRSLNSEQRLILQSLAQIAAGEIERQYPPLG